MVTNVIDTENTHVFLQQLSCVHLVRAAIINLLLCPTAMLMHLNVDDVGGYYILIIIYILKELSLISVRKVKNILIV